MSARKRPLVVPKTSLIDLNDALHTVGCTVDVVSTALGADTDPAMGRAAWVLHEHVFMPLEKARAAIKAHAANRRDDPPEMHAEHLVKPRRRKKRAPNGSRKGKKRQRNRWKDRQKALKPWERQ